MRPPPSEGAYVIEISLARARWLEAGSLGRVRLEAGTYLYVGRALRGLAARLARHRRHGKPPRWHIDYLTNIARVTAAWAWPPEAALECRLAAALRARHEAVPGFGATDCRCGGHLFRTPARLHARDMPLADLIVWQWRDVAIRGSDRK